MAIIKQYLDNILNAVFGKDVRKSIHDGIEAINNDVIESVSTSKKTEARQDLLENKYDEQIKNIAASEPQSPEIVDARQGFSTLGNLLKRKVFFFENVATMKKCLTLMIGDTVKTLGYYKENDCGSAEYNISGIKENDLSIQLNNGLYANIILNDTINPNQIGAKADDENFDNGPYFEKAIHTKLNVILQSNSHYYFKNFVDCSEIYEANVDLNKSTLINFHTYFNLNDNKTTWRSSYPVKTINFYNGVIGSENHKVLPDNWDKPVFYSGSGLCLTNILFRNQPYILAFTKNYHDVLKFTELTLSHDKELFEQEDLTLDAISAINENTGMPERVEQETIFGDGWIFNNVNEFKFENKDYALVRSVSTKSCTFINCIQSNVRIASYMSCTFIGCYWENSNIKFISDEAMSKYQANLLFLNCFFYGVNNTILNARNVVYNNCFFRHGVDRSSKNNYSNFINSYLYELNCRLIHCSFGGSTIIDTEKEKSNFTSPKFTWKWYREYRTKLADANFTVRQSDAVNFVKKGAYTYYIYLLATQATNLAIDNTTKSISITEDNNALFFQLSNCTGGYGYRIVRVNPDNEIEETIHFFDPQYRIRENVGLTISFMDYGDFCYFNIENQEYVTNEVYECWKKILTLPDIKINTKAYQCGGVLITDDNSKVVENIEIPLIQVNKSFNP